MNINIQKFVNCDNIYIRIILKKIETNVSIKYLRRRKNKLLPIFQQKNTKNKINNIVNKQVSFERGNNNPRNIRDLKTISDFSGRDQNIVTSCMYHLNHLLLCIKYSQLPQKGLTELIGLGMDFCINYTINFISFHPSQGSSVAKHILNSVHTVGTIVQDIHQY